MQKHQYEVVVVGAGGAGLTAALYASQTPAQLSSVNFIQHAPIQVQPREVLELLWGILKKIILNGMPLIP